MAYYKIKFISGECVTVEADSIKVYETDICFKKGYAIALNAKRDEVVYYADVSYLVNTEGAQ